MSNPNNVANNTSTSDKKKKLNIRIVVFLGMMGALSIILDFVGAIRLAPYVRIGISDLPNRLTDFLFGPLIGALFGGVMDIVKFMVNPDGAFFPGYTITAIVASLIFGAITHGKNGHKLSFVRLFIAELLVKLIPNLVLNTTWNLILFKPDLAALPLPELFVSDAFRAYMTTRIISNLVQLPIDTIVIFTVLTALEKSKVLPQIRAWIKGN